MCRSRWLVSLAAFLPLVLLTGMPLRAERYALLAGISVYPNGINHLEGPEEDIRAVKEMLVRQGYALLNISVLLNDQATRQNILKALDSEVSRLKAGDHLFFYFSGHGTSAFDKNNREISPAIGPDSGGLIPADLSLKSLQSVVDSLVIGRRDLRPILARVPPKAQAFVVLDSCYSENSAKSVGLWSEATPRTIHPIDLIGDTSGPPAGTTPGTPAGGTESGVYPYSNVISLAAASKSQTAVDIGSELIRRGAQTVDGKPHGALTNSVLLGLAGRADTNGDGSISYDELYRFVRRDMEKYPHQPQLLTPTAFSLDQPALGSRGGRPAVPPIPNPAAGNSVSKIRVKLENPSPDLESGLKALPEVQIVAEPYDLLVRAERNQWKIYDASSTLVAGFLRPQTAQVAARVRAYGQLARLRNWSNPSQSFNVRVDVEPANATGYDRLRTTFRIGEPAKFKIGTEREAYLLLLDINKDGRVAVLFPGPDKSDSDPQKPTRPVEFTAPATEPAGSDQLKLIGFLQRPAQWADWACAAKACPEFDGSDRRLVKLLEMLQTNPEIAEASLRVITGE